MADELNIEVKIQYSPSSGGMSGVSLPGEDLLIDMEGRFYESGTALLQTGEVELEPDRDLESIGYVYIKNIGENNCRVGSQDELVIKLKPGEICLFRATGPVFANTETGISYIEYIIFED